MRTILAVRDVLSRFYGKYDTIIRLICKALLALIAFSAINRELGQAVWLNSWILIVGLSVVCAFLPSNSIAMIGAALILVHFYGMSLETALAGGGMLVVGLLLYFSVAPHSCVPLVLTAIFLGMKIPAAIPIIFGLIDGPLSAVGVIFGVFVYHLIRAAAAAGGNLQATASEPAEAMVQKMTFLIDEVISNKEMIFMGILLALLLWLVWLVRRMEIRYAWMVAACLGIAAYVAARLIAAPVLGLEVDAVFLTLDVVTAVAASWLSQMMLFSLNYKKTESIRFEDDEYFYYVKAVPKRKIKRRKRVRRSERRQ